MSAVDVIRVIGLTHALQPPLTWLLASERGLALCADVTARTPLGARVVENMAFAAVALPTLFGLLLAVHAPEVLRDGAGRSVALLLALFWSWRLFRQLTALRVAWPRERRLAAGLEPCLVAIFCVQGPLLGCLVLWTRLE